MMSVPAPVSKRVHQDQLNSDTIIISSPMRFGSGGSARLARLAINHHVAMRGSATCRPRASAIVRLCVRS